MAFSPGTWLNDCELLAPIGSGGRGEVMLRDRIKRGPVPMEEALHIAGSDGGPMIRRL